MSQEKRYQQAKYITLCGALINVLLCIIKLTGGWFYQSNALLADGVHSFSDLIIDFMVIFAAKYGSQDADVNHPYGHQRIETAATLILALLLILTGAGIAWESILTIQNAKFPPISWLALPIAIISFLANEILFHCTKYFGTKIRSPIILANAWHHRSDALSSAVVSLGLIGTLCGVLYLDAMAAIFVGIMIIKMGIDYGWNSVKELIDTAVEPVLLNKIKKIIESVPGVEKIHQLRSRLMGHDVLVDVHILVSPMISVSEGHYIAQHVHHTLVEKVECVKDVIVHVDPEDDEVVCPSMHLPNRETIQASIIKKWQEHYPAISHWVLHYVDGKIIIDLIFAQNIDNLAKLQKYIARTLKNIPYQIKVRIYTSNHRNLDFNAE